VASSWILAHLLGSYRLLGSLVQLLNGLLVEAQILLAADEDDGQALAEVQNLGDPLRGIVSRSACADLGRGETYLLLYVVERVGRVDGKANEDNVGVGVRERAETVVIFLASGIPEGELDVLAVNLDIGNVVLEDSGDVDLGRESCQCMCSVERQICLLRWRRRPARLTQLRAGGEKRGGD
jgi:hypothetical protein